MITDNKKTARTTLTAFTKQHAPSNSSITKTNNKVMFLDQNDLAGAIASWSRVGYSDWTIVNPIVRFEPLFCNTIGVRRTLKTCAFFVSILWWRCTCWLLASYCAYRSGFNLCNVTALTLEPVLSGGSINSIGATNMSIPKAYNRLTCLFPNGIRQVFTTPVISVYDRVTALNHAVSFDRLKNDKKGAQTPLALLLGVFLCPSYNGSRAWEAITACWFSFFVPVCQPAYGYRLMFDSINGSFLNIQNRKLYAMSNPSKILPCYPSCHCDTTQKQGGVL